jgi:hypothetical protein
VYAQARGTQRLAAVVRLLSEDMTILNDAERMERASASVKPFDLNF